MSVLYTCFIILFMMANATPGIYFSSEGCGPPKVDGSYMGGENIAGDNLELTINEQKLEEFNKVGFEFGKGYTMALQTKDDEWMQFVVHTSHGKQDSAMGMLECDGKVSLFAMDFNIADFTWTAPSKDEINDGDVIMTTTYAPAYTNAFVQAFTIKSKASVKTDL